MADATTLDDRRAAIRVAIVYPFFAHYREPVLRELLTHGRHEYLFVADVKDPSGSIPTLSVEDRSKFLLAPVIPLGRRLLWQRGLVRLALRSDIDCYVFLGNASFVATWVAAGIVRLRGRRVFFWTHGWTKSERGPKAWLRACFYRLAHRLLLYGHTARRIGIEAGFAADRMHVIYNSLDVRKQHQLLDAITREDVQRTRRELFDTEILPVAIAVGRLTRIKRFDLLIRAAAIIAARGRRLGVLIVGTGPALPELQALAKALNVDVRFYGGCYDEPTMARLFASATVTVSPGNVGLTCMHSLGYGIPVITHDDETDQMPEWEAIAPGLTGDFFTKNSASALAATMERWTTRPYVAADTRQACIGAIMERYHPAVQRRLLEGAIADENPQGDATSPQWIDA